MRLKKAAQFVRETVEQTLKYMSYPHEYWQRLRTNNSLERVMKEIKLRTKVIGSLPNSNSALMLSAARLRKWLAPNGACDGTWICKGYTTLNMNAGTRKKSRP